ncbi:TPA: phage tail family protein [Staphylococcus aureus]|nr:phage tail family protein [Staphylococcus aureus]
MDIEIIKNNGQTFYLSDYQIIVSDIKIQSIEMTDKYQDFEGIHGRRLVSSVYHKRKIVVPAFFIAENNVDFAIQRDLMFQLLQDHEPFYIRELRKFEKDQYRFKDTTQYDYQEVNGQGTPIYNKQANVYVSGNQYLVKLVNVMVPIQKLNKCNVVFEFETVELPFAESSGASIQLHHNEIDNYWDFALDIDFNDTSKRTYIFENINKGKVFYHGTVPNNQFNMYKKVKIIIGTSTNAFDWSLNNRQTMSIKDIDLDAGDVLVYDGLNITKNNESIVEKTNIELPAFYPGFNNFLFNQTVKRVEFDMRFYKK